MASPPAPQASLSWTASWLALAAMAAVAAASGSSPGHSKSWWLAQLLLNVSGASESKGLSRSPAYAYSSAGMQDAQFTSILPSTCPA